MAISYSFETNLTEDLRRFKFVNDILNNSIRLYSKISLLPVFSIINKSIKIIVTIIFGIIAVPIGYVLIVYVLKKSTKTITNLINNLQYLSVSELETINRLFNKIDNNNIHEEAHMIKVSSTPFILKPLVISLKECLKQYVMLRNEINHKINSDLDLFSEALNVSQPLGMDNT